MGHDWILDVLSDLKAFARANHMQGLVAQLDDASYVARAEIASMAEGEDLGVFGAHTRHGRVAGNVGAGPGSA